MINSYLCIIYDLFIRTFSNNKFIKGKTVQKLIFASDALAGYGEQSSRRKIH